MRLGRRGDELMTAVGFHDERVCLMFPQWLLRPPAEYGVSEQVSDVMRE